MVSTILMNTLPPPLTSSPTSYKKRSNSRAIPL
jgi:hypothetical protein